MVGNEQWGSFVGIHLEAGWVELERRNGWMDGWMEGMGKYCCLFGSDEVWGLVGTSCAVLGGCVSSHSVVSAV